MVDFVHKKSNKLEVPEKINYNFFKIRGGIKFLFLFFQIRGAGNYFFFKIEVPEKFYFF